MAKPRLPFNTRLNVATQIAIQARIYFDVWWHYRGDPTHENIRDTLDLYSEFYRFDTQAHFVSFIIHIASLFESRPGTINLLSLIDEAKGKVKSEAAKKAEIALATAGPIVKKASILRSNLFAHRSDSLNYNAAFEKADTTPDEMRSLTDSAIEILDYLCSDLGLQGPHVNDLPVEDLKGILDDIANQNEI